MNISRARKGELGIVLLSGLLARPPKKLVLDALEEAARLGDLFAIIC